MIQLLILFSVLLLGGFFAASASAFLNSGRLQLELESEKETWTATILNQFVNNPEQYLITSLIGSVLATVVFTTVLLLYLQNMSTAFWARWVGQDFTMLPVIILTGIAGSFLLVIAAQLLPNKLFRFHTDRQIKNLAFPQQLFYWLFWPFRKVIHLFVYSPDSADNSPSMFGELINQHGRDIDEDDSEMLSNVLELSDKRVKESMIPRTDMRAVEENTSIKETLQVFISSGYSKLPVYRESIDDIIGVIFAYDLFNNPEALTEIMRPVKLVPVSQKSKDLLSEFRSANISVAIAIDEYGGTAGMVTIEDLLEEVVGDIKDEYDTESHLVNKLSEGTYILSAGIEIEDLMDEYPEIDLPDDSDDFETVAGYIIHAAGRIPKVNEELQIDGLKFIIGQATSSRIERIKLVMEG